MENNVQVFTLLGVCVYFVWYVFVEVFVFTILRYVI